MNYTLMHKDIPFADLTLDETTGSIQRIDALFRGGTCLWASLSVVAWQTGLPSTHGGRTGSFLPPAQG